MKSTVFSTFDKDQLANIHQHYWKECLKISKPAKFESDMLEVSKDRALQSRKILQTFVWLGGKFVDANAEPAWQALRRGREKGNRARATRGEKEKEAPAASHIVYFVFLVRRGTKNRHWLIFNYASVIA